MTAGANPTSLQRGINKAVESHRGRTGQNMSKKVSDRSEIAQVATVSANWDKNIGEIIADAMDKVGKDGTITVEEAKTIETTLDVVEGMQFDKGYLSPYFVTNAESMETILDNAVHPHPREEDQLPQGPAPAPRKGGEVGPAVAHHRGRRGRRSPRHARGEQAARHAAGCRRQGPGLR